MKQGIPSVADYAHWNEEAEQVWYLENRYDMENPETYEPDWDEDPYQDPFEDSFDTEAEAREFTAGLKFSDGAVVTNWGDSWYVEHWDAEAHEARKRYEWEQAQ